VLFRSIGVQIQSGGVGVDLSRASYAAYYSMTFSLGDYEQSLARLRRPGQSGEHVRYYHFLAKDSIDELIYRALHERKDVIESVLQGVGGLAESFTKKERKHERGSDIDGLGGIVAQNQRKRAARKAT